MKQLFIGLFVGFIIGISCIACCSAKGQFFAEPLKQIMTDRYFVNTTKVVTGDGEYRIFTIENRNGSSANVGISAVKIK